MSASSPGGVPLGYATPGDTLERLDFFDERYRTHVCLVTGSSGSGKTVAVNALLARNLARGATGYLIDRSSSEDEGGSTRHAGHYEQLAAADPRCAHHPLRRRPAPGDPQPLGRLRPRARARVQGRIPRRAAHAADRRPQRSRPARARRPGAHAAGPRHRRRLRPLRPDRRAAARAAALRAAATPRPRAGRRRAGRRRDASPRNTGGSPSGCTPTSATDRPRGSPISRPRSRPARRWCCLTSPACPTRSPAR